MVKPRDIAGNAEEEEEEDDEEDLVWLVPAYFHSWLSLVIKSSGWHVNSTLEQGSQETT